MTPASLADLHARAIRVPRPWSAAEFTDLLASPLAYVTGDKCAFAFGRVVAGEAELLTIVTDPEHRRRGLGRKVLAAFESEAVRRGATRAFLEVAADNAGARRLYLSAGYAEVGLRPRYYATAESGHIDAVLMAKTLESPAIP